MAETLRPGTAYDLAYLSGDSYYENLSRAGDVYLSGLVAKDKYLLRGHLYERDPPEYEQWVSQGLPLAPNPSGEPIQNVTVLAVWK